MNRLVTKKSVENRIRQIANSTKLNLPLAGDELKTVMEVLQQHKDWAAKVKGSPFVEVVVRENRAYGQKKTRGFWLLREDGSETDISWREAIYPSSHESNVKRAFRNLVAYQSEHFRRHDPSVTRSTGGQFCCDNCFNRVPASNSEVDHKPPLEFRHLVARFLEEYGLTLHRIELAESGDGMTIDTLGHYDLAQEWREWHKEHATLWLVCKPCHKRLTADRKRKIKYEEVEQRHCNNG